MRFRQVLTLINPGPSATHLDTGNEVPGQPVETQARGLLQPLSTSEEKGDGSLTVITGWRAWIEPDATVTSATRIRDPRGHLFEVVGDPAPLDSASGRPDHLAVAVQMVSDLQEA